MLQSSVKVRKRGGGKYSFRGTSAFLRPQDACTHAPVEEKHLGSAHPHEVGAEHARFTHRRSAHLCVPSRPRSRRRGGHSTPNLAWIPPPRSGSEALLWGPRRPLPLETTPGPQNQNGALKHSFLGLRSDALWRGPASPLRCP